MCLTGFPNVKVLVAQTGRHERPARTKDVISARCDAGFDRRDMPVCHEHICTTVQSARRIDHPPAANQQAHSHSSTVVIARAAGPWPPGNSYLSLRDATRRSNLLTGG